MSGTENQMSSAKKFPPGVKCHIYEELNKQQNASRKSHWKHIYGLINVNVSKNQNVISEILDSYYKQGDTMERVLQKFQRGERIEKEDLKDDQLNFSIGASLTLSQAMKGNSRRIRFSNMKLNRSHVNKGGHSNLNQSRMMSGTHALSS